MPYPTKAVLNCTDPHAQARFWALALDRAVEDNSPLTGALLAAGQITEADVVLADGRPVWKTVAAIRHTDAAVDERSGMGRGARMLFQVDADSAARGRPTTTGCLLHLDIEMGRDGRDAHVRRLLAAGATHLWDGHQGGADWLTLADPEGNVFCVA